MRKYSVELSDGTVAEASYIGLNYDPNSNCQYYDNIISSYNKYFDNKDELIISNDEKGLRIATIGDITRAYQLLKTEIVSRDPRDAEAYLECVQYAVEQYLGPYSNRKKRVKFFPTEEEVNNGKTRGKISELGKNDNRNIALSLERAVVAQNLLLSCCVEINTYFKISITNINGKDRVHSYNLVQDAREGRYYICDFAIPTTRNGKVTPIICEIPEEVFNQMISPLPDIGYSVAVDYNNPVNKKNYTITYDSGRDNVYNVDQTITKKKVYHE